MRPISFTHFRLAASASVVIWAVAACGDSVGLPPATIPNWVDTITLAAIQNTPIPDASALDILTATKTRTDMGQPFDLLFDIDSTGTAMLIPAGLLGFQTQAGWRATTQEFSAITSAPAEDYTGDQELVLVAGDVFFGRSRNSSTGCEFLGTALSRYGKFHVLALDTQERTVTLETMVDLNCGYRGLEPGFPTS